MTPESTKYPPPRERPEPTSGNATVSVWLIVVFGALFYWGQLYISDHAGGFEQQVYAPFHTLDEVAAANPKDKGQEFLLMGKDVFDKTCAACHQPNGLGKEGTAPPLAGSEWVVAPGPNRIAHAVLYGLTGPVTVKGKEYNLNMLAWKDVYDDEHLAAALSYVRNTWGNKAPMVKPEEVAAARKEGRKVPETAPEMMTLPEKMPGM